MRKIYSFILCSCLKNIFLFLFTLTACLSFSQDKVNEQIWLDFNPSYNLSKNVTLSGDIGARTIFPNKWNRFYVRPGLTFSFKPFINPDGRSGNELSAGLGIFYTNNFTNPNVLEIRPFQGFRLGWPNFNRIKFRHYVRLEERLEYSQNKSRPDFAIRLRYMIDANISWKKHLMKFATGVYVPISIEFFWDIKSAKQFNDLIRFTPGLGYTFDDKWKTQFDLSYHYSKSTVEKDFKTSDIVFRLRLFYKIPH